MIIMQSDYLNVYLFRDIDYKGSATYTVKYGLEVKQFNEWASAFNQYQNACNHSAQCEGL